MLSIVRCSAVLLKSNLTQSKNSIVLQCIRPFANDNRTKGHDKPGRERKNSVRERTREDSRKSANHREGEESNVAGMKDLLDKIDQGVDVPLKVRGLYLLDLFILFEGLRWRILCYCCGLYR